MNYNLDCCTYQDVLYVTVFAEEKSASSEELLSQEARQFQKRFGALPALAAKTYPVLAERSFGLLKRLTLLGKCAWRGQKVVIDPFTKTELIVEVTRYQEGVGVKGMWRQGGRQGALCDCSCLVPGHPGWMVKHAIVYPVECDSFWAKRLEGKECLLQGPQAVECLERLKREPPGEILWKSVEEVGPLPYLILTDRHGAFANLGFDYGGMGKFLAHDTSSSFIRSSSREQEWERDLLETDFQKKWVEGSHYYCPLDKVAKSLTFLLEIGWKIFDYQERQVIRQKNSEISTHLSGEYLLLRGKVHYENHSVDLKNVVGAFTRKERFIDLSEGVVGLLDPKDREKYENLSGSELIGDTLAIRKECVGLLDDFLEKKEVPAPFSLSLPEGWSYEEKEIPSTFLGQLFPYQKEGVKWLEFLRQSGCSGLLADEMGLGKTVQIVAFFSYLSPSVSLVVVPTSLLFNWKREFERFFPTCPLHVHDQREGPLPDQGVILTSYALLRLDAPLFQKLCYQLVVLDEAQTIKNPQSQIAKVAFSLKSQMRLAVTGTPIENRLEDLWSLFHFLMPSLLQERGEFRKELQAALLDARYLQRIKKKVRPFILRRKKEQVGLQLPPKMEQLVWVDMSQEQRVLYDSFLQKTRAGLITKLNEGQTALKRMDVLEAILRLRQLCVHPWLVENSGEGEFFALSGKCERLFLDMQEAIEEGKKVLIYSQFTTLLHLICREVANRGWRAVYLDGQTKDREAVVRQFQEDPTTQLFLISLKAGGVGLNLTAADYVFLCDPWWNNAVEAQAIDRAHRLGRGACVIARRYITTLSIEEKLMRLKEHKLTLSQGVFDDNKEAQGFSLEELTRLILA